LMQLRSLSGAEFHAPVDYSLLQSADARRAYYRENGYIVRTGLLDTSLAEQLLSAFRNEIKPYRGYLYRQASANPERHRFDASGNVLNSLLNPLSVSSRQFPSFRSSCASLLGSDPLFDAVEELLGDSAKLVQSMYFEANPATWPHQDCYYLDSECPGGMLGAWIALEEIEAEAGRFYVVPGSHNFELGQNRGHLNIGTSHDAYKRTVQDAIRNRRMELRAPPMKSGDVLFWNSRTIHGAQEPSSSDRTRNSVTAHFMPASSYLIQYQCIPTAMKADSIGGHAVCRPKDQNRRINQWIMNLEIMAPETFRLVKRKTISWKIKRLAK